MSRGMYSAAGSGSGAPSFHSSFAAFFGDIFQNLDQRGAAFRLLLHFAVQMGQSHADIQPVRKPGIGLREQGDGFLLEFRIDLSMMC